MKKVTIKKPMYGAFVYIRDRVLYDAIHDGERIQVCIPQGSAIIDPKEWIRTGKKLEKVFKIPNRPMVLWGNHVPIAEHIKQDQMI